MSKQTRNVLSLLSLAMSFAPSAMMLLEMSLVDASTVAEQIRVSGAENMSGFGCETTYALMVGMEVCALAVFWALYAAGLTRVTLFLVALTVFSGVSFFYLNHCFEIEALLGN